MNAVDKGTGKRPSALDTATFAVTQLEDNPLFNAGHGAVFTRDGINELESSVMVSRGYLKRGVGVMGLRRVRNPILLAKAMLEHGDVDLGGPGSHPSAVDDVEEESHLDVPSAQGHTQIHGEAAESLARKYGLDMVKPSYFFTQKRWDEHIKALEREKKGTGLSTWSADEYLPQGTVGAIALDDDGVVCCATSTGGLTNKLTGRIGDTPTVGAGFWAEEWVEEGNTTGVSQDKSLFQRMLDYSKQPGPVVSFSESLRGLLADCLLTPFNYNPIPNGESRKTRTTRSIALSGTGNGDSFLRVGAARTAGAIARFARQPGSVAVSRVSGPGGELQASAGNRWGRTGEGEGGLIGIECVVVRDEAGRTIETRSEILQDFNCNGMFRTWIDDDGKAQVRVWRDDEEEVFRCGFNDLERISA